MLVRRMKGMMDTVEAMTWIFCSVGLMINITLVNTGYWILNTEY